MIKNVRNLFKLKQENEETKDRIIKDIRTLFEQEEEKGYYKPIRGGNFWNKNFLVSEKSSDRNKNVSVKRY